MDGQIVDLYQEHIKGSLDRRDFLKKLTILAGGVTAANTLLSLLEKDSARAEIVSEEDPRLQVERIKYQGETGNVSAYQAWPKGDAKLPGVIVVHENRGLNPHIEDVARRLAVEGYLTIAPDALSPLGGTPDDPDEARSLIGKLDAQATTSNYVAAVKYLKTHPVSTGKVGVVGFCWGGGVANQLAVKSPDLSAAVPFYGRQPVAADVPKIKASLLLHYAGIDDRINRGIPAFEKALQKASIDYQLYMYEGVRHAFHNDTSTARYNKAAAQLAWKRTILFFNEKLS
jgi:carboxymethylenebutenolidase